MWETITRGSKVLALKMGLNPGSYSLLLHVACVFLFLSLATILMLHIIQAGGGENEKSVAVNGKNGRKSSAFLRAIQSFDNSIEDANFYSNSIEGENLREVTTLFAPDCSRGHPSLLILVTSSAKNFDRRKAIRNSWARDGSKLQSTWRTVFLVGKTGSAALDAKVETESINFEDVLVGDYKDTYRNLTKKVQHGMSWASTSCRPRYLLKTDDDCFVNTQLLADFLISENEVERRLYAGNLPATSRDLGSLPVIRDDDSKWFVSDQEYSPGFFPKYASGTGYIISADVLDSILLAAAITKPFPIEDAYTGVLVHQVGVPLIRSQRFTFYNKNWRVCNYRYLFVIHGVAPDEQLLCQMHADKSRSACQGENVKGWD